MNPNSHYLIHIAVLAVSYLIGSLPFGVIFSKLFGLADPRSYGSKNIGATNVLRSGHKLAAALTLLGDLLKGFIVIKLAAWAIPFGFLPNYIFLLGIAVFIGHIYSVFLNFNGGKGVAVAAGVLLALTPYIGAFAVLTWLIVFVSTRTSALAALSAASLVLFSGILLVSMPYAITLVFMALFLIYRHRENIGRILNNSEFEIKINK